MWLKNWGWLKDPQLGPDFEMAAGKARDHVEQHTVLATDTLNKPLVLEEFGLPRDHENYSPDIPDPARDEYYRRMFDQVAESCRAGRALQAREFLGLGRRRPRRRAKMDSAAALHGRPVLRTAGIEFGFRHRQKHARRHRPGQRKTGGHGLICANFERRRRDIFVETHI